MHTHMQPAQTHGSLIRWATYYDPVVQLMTLGRARRLRRRTANLAQIQSGDRVLDVGCGTGDLTLLAKERAGAAGLVVGIDPSPEMIAVARHKAERKGITVNYRLGVIETLPFADSSFDVVVSSLMMHHLPETVKAQGLREIWRILRADGHLLIVDLTAPKSFYDKFIITLMMHGGMQRGIAEVSNQLASAGFYQITTGSLNMMALGYASAYAHKGEATSSTR